jgi:two-component system cell cycle response regulator DivK
MPKKVLYIEDNPNNMRLIRKILTHAGYAVIEAYSGEAGIALAEEQSPDIMLIDINLPDIDGVEVVARLRAMSRFEHTPMVALTANAMHGDRERYLSAGFNYYIPKPITQRELLTTISEFIGKPQGA